jgi:hypothetical protein
VFPCWSTLGQGNWTLRAVCVCACMCVQYEQLCHSSHQSLILKVQTVSKVEIHSVLTGLITTEIALIAQSHIMIIIFPYTTVLWIKFLFLVFQILCRDCS